MNTHAGHNATSSSLHFDWYFFLGWIHTVFFRSFHFPRNSQAEATRTKRKYGGTGLVCVVLSRVDGLCVCCTCVLCVCVCAKGERLLSYALLTLLSTIMRASTRTRANAHAHTPSRTHTHTQTHRHTHRHTHPHPLDLKTHTGTSHFATARASDARGPVCGVQSRGGIDLHPHPPRHAGRP